MKHQNHDIPPRFSGIPTPSPRCPNTVLLCAAGGRKAAVVTAPTQIHQFLGMQDQAASVSPHPGLQTYLIHIKRAEHLFDVLVGLRIQPPQPKELLEFVLGQLPRRTLGHELLVPVVDLDRLQVIHGGGAVVPHRREGMRGGLGPLLRALQRLSDAVPLHSPRRARLSDGYTFPAVSCNL